MSVDARDFARLVCSFEQLANKAGDLVGLDDLGVAAKMELAKYLMYLSCSDGTLRSSEVDFINEILGLSITPVQMKTFIDDEGIYSTEFERKVPVTFEALLKLDEALHSNGVMLGESMAEKLYDLYEMAGKLFVEADGNANWNEVNDRNTYLTMLGRFIHENRDNYSDGLSMGRKC